jgi:protein-tyrosine phosphatase
MVNVCFVCLGNICRSPTAEGVMARLVDRAGLGDAVRVSSAGTAAAHAGEPADPRSRAHARKRGYTLGGRARQFREADFPRFDLVLAMDASNASQLRSLARDDAARAKVVLLRSFDPESPSGGDVPDPYYGGDAGFEEVLDICERSCASLLAHLRQQHGL